MKELRSIGIQPDILLCRCDRPMPESERRKIALFCNVRPEAVIQALDVSSIYEVPLAYHGEGLDREVLAAFGIKDAPEPDLAKWRTIADAIANPEGEVTIAIVGKYTGLKDAYKSLNEALLHGGIANRVQGQARLDRERGVRERGPGAATSRACTASWCRAASASAARRARSWPPASPATRKVPYFGICFGMQMAVIEAARNLVRPRGRRLDRVRPDARSRWSA